METKVNYGIVGLFVLILGAAIIIIPLWLSSSLSNKHYVIYAVHMYESVSGLSPNAPVKYNGVDVGTVKSIALNIKNPQEVDILLNIIEGTPITTATTATLSVQGLTGVANIELKGSDPKARPLVAKPNQPYPLIQSSPSFMAHLIDTINHVSDELSRLLNPANQRAIRNSLANIDRITSVFATNAAQLNSSIQSANIALHNTAVASQQFPIVVNNIKNDAEQFDQLVQQWNSLSSSLSNTTLPKVNDVLGNLQSFSQSVKQNPSVLIRGQQNRPLGPGEQ